MNSVLKNLTFYVFVGLFLWMIWANLSDQPTSLDFSHFAILVDEKVPANGKSISKIQHIKINGQKITGDMLVVDKDKNGNPKYIPQTFITYIPEIFNGIYGKKLFESRKMGIDNGIVIKGGPPEDGKWFTNILINFLPIIIFIGIWIYFIQKMNGAGGKAMSFGKSRAKLFVKEKMKITFSDVAGCDEAKQELEEIIEFLKAPQKFQKLGGKIPKGVLLVGSPGTGKTLLAKAVAGEAKVPFFSISGSDFVEMFVGVGASRVRDLFHQAKKKSPCLIFIDEIDAVGRQRGSGLGGGHDEREQTLNALLVEMDGFEVNEGVILIAATNRPDVLDPALLRPGRFDREVYVDLPDIKGRLKILEVHTKKIPISDDVKLIDIARGTPGMAGADLANIVNESALLAARKNQDTVTMQDFEDAKDKIMIGVEQKSKVIHDDEKETTAYHEAGHALIQKLLDNCDKVHKVSIIPRGRALGVTHSLPERDKYTHSKEYFLDMLVSLMGGRAAEEIKFNKFTTGASNDISRATALSHRMICAWGMSDNLGPRTFGKREEHIFLGREISQVKDYSESTATAIDKEISIFIDRAYNTAKSLLSKNFEKLENISKILLILEDIDGETLDLIIKGKYTEENALEDSKKNTANKDIENAEKILEEIDTILDEKDNIDNKINSETNTETPKDTEK